jgi:hypothetical protein
MNFDISILCRFCSFPLQPTRLLPDLTVIGVIGGCLTRSRNCLPFVITWVHLRFFVEVGVANFFCDVLSFYMFYVFVLCLVCPMLLVSPDCPFDLLYYLLNLHIIIKFHHIFYFWSIAVFVYLEPKRMGFSFVSDYICIS